MSDSILLRNVLELVASESGDTLAETMSSGMPCVAKNDWDTEMVVFKFACLTIYTSIHLEYLYTEY